MSGQEFRHQFTHCRQEGLSSLGDRSPKGGALAEHRTTLQSRKRSQNSSSPNGTSFAKRTPPVQKVAQRRKHPKAPAIRGRIVSLRLWPQDLRGSGRVWKETEKSLLCLSLITRKPTPVVTCEPKLVQRAIGHRYNNHEPEGIPGDGVQLKASKKRLQRKIGNIQQSGAHNLATAGALEIETVDENEVLAAEISREAGRESHNSGHGRKRARLTRENLAAFDQMARKKAPASASASLTANPVAESPPSTGTKSTTASGFAIQAYENGILKSWSSKPPSNIRLIHENHLQPRHSPSPTESEYKRFVRDVKEARNEATLLNKTSKELLKQYRDEGYTYQLNCAFSSFPKDSGINNGLSAPQPDFVEGLKMQEFYPFPIHEQIKGAVLYQDDPCSLTLPQLAGEWKGRGKDMDRAELQSSYDGAALVYSRNQALAYAGKSDPPGHSQVMTFTTDGTNLNLFAHYAAPSPVDGRLQYHQYPIDSMNLTISHQRFKDGRRGLRNAQDRARQQAYILRDDLTGYWEQQRRAGLGGAAGGGPPPLHAAAPSSDEMDGSEGGLD